MENLIDMVGFNELYAPQSKAYGVIKIKDDSVKIIHIHLTGPLLPFRAKRIIFRLYPVVTRYVFS